MAWTDEDDRDRMRDSVACGRCGNPDGRCDHGPDPTDPDNWSDEEVAAYEAEERRLASYRKRCAERETDSDTNPNEGG